MTTVPEAAVTVLHNDALPFYAKLDLPMTAVLADNGDAALNDNVCCHRQKFAIIRAKWVWI